MENIAQEEDKLDIFVQEDAVREDIEVIERNVLRTMQEHAHVRAPEVHKQVSPTTEKPVLPSTFINSAPVSACLTESDSSARPGLQELC